MFAGERGEGGGIDFDYASTIFVRFNYRGISCCFYLYLYIFTDVCAVYMQGVRLAL
jgi:hypothetical protein